MVPAGVEKVDQGAGRGLRYSLGLRSCHIAHILSTLLPGVSLGCSLGKWLGFLPVMQPEDGVIGRGLEGAHVATATTLIVDLIVDIFKTGKASIVSRSTPLVVREGIKVGVRQQEQCDVRSSRGRLVGEDLSNNGVTGSATAVWVSHRGAVSAPLQGVSKSTHIEANEHGLRTRPSKSPRLGRTAAKLKLNSGLSIDFETPSISTTVIRSEEIALGKAETPVLSRCAQSK